jgi:predicted GIY-YIG superfamily endonuclease
MAQPLLIPDPRPLDERLGELFFRQAPENPGIYLMRGHQDEVLYVGKAKNLRKRLGNYRTANPDKMPRRHLRLLRLVLRIELQICEDEVAALQHEKRLILALKPRFNRAGVWPSKFRFIEWRFVGNEMELAIVDAPNDSWQRFGIMGTTSRFIHQSLSRLLWLALNPDMAYADLPLGWIRGEMGERVRFDCGKLTDEVSTALSAYFHQSSEELIGWFQKRFAERVHPFELAVIEAELELLKDFAAKHVRPEAKAD